MPRKSRIDSPGVLHHVIGRGINRQKIFSDNTDYNNFIQRLGDLLSESKTSCYAWALIPNHFHLLLRTGQTPLPTVMQRLLTGYAVSYNRRHRRTGHLFQNRYKSILCQEDIYLLELVRYIHLNPLRVKVVPDYKSLSRFPFCGHGVILGRRKHDWQDSQFVLRLFGSKEGTARRSYREFVGRGIKQGRRPDLTGGGLLRSHGGWDGVKALRAAGEYQKGDERILGDGDFVSDVLAQAEEKFEQKYLMRIKGYSLKKLAERVAEIMEMNAEEIFDSVRDRKRIRARSILCYWATEMLGISQVKLSQIFNQTQSTISHAVRRGRLLVQTHSLTIE